MNPRHPPLKPNARSTEQPPRPEQPHWAPRIEFTREFESETRQEGELFQNLMNPDANSLAFFPDFSGDGFSDGFADEQHVSTQTSSPPAHTTQLWDALLAHIDTYLTPSSEAPMEAFFEFPQLGKVAVQLINCGDSLEIAVRFAQSEACKRCQPNREVFREWLSQRLGRRVQLTLDAQAH